MALLWCVLACALAAAQAQSNYGSQANNIEYQGEGLPEQTVLDGKVTKLDDLSPVIFLNRTKAALNCAAGSMQIEMKFNEKFYGIAYADFDRNSACQVRGKGALSYKLELPLKGCGTKQDPLRVFTNNIVVRFHPGLEMDGDEVITIVCRYPPPIVPKPVPIPLINTPEPGPLPAKAPLAGTHILMIICAILFLTLLLLGLGVSYLCLRRRALPAPRRFIDDSSASIVSRESIQEVKIPRAHPVYPPAAEAVSMASDTIPSDYPSETPSEAEATHTNQAFTMDESYHSEGYGETRETLATNARLVSGAAPAFDVRVRVQRPPVPPSPPSTITATETDGGSMRQTLMTEEHERQESVRTVSPVALPLPARASQLPPPERPPRPPAVYSQVHREKQKPPPPPPMMSQRLETEEQEMLMESLEPIPETPIMPARKPEITSHVVDDVFLRTITEKKTIEDIERHKRLVTEYKQVPAPPPQFDVTIRNHTVPEAQWENFSDISSASGMTLTPKMERVPLSLPPQKYIGKGGPDLFSPELIKQSSQSYQASSDLPLLPELPPARNPLFRDEDDEDVPEPTPAPPVPANWSVLTRVLKIEAQDEVLLDTERSWRLTRSERLRWRELIAHESTLRRALSAASTRDDFTRVAHDHRFAPLYAPHKWDVIIRILAPPADKPKNRYRKKTEWDSRSRRSSLPTLYEYDSDATSLRDPQRSRRSSYRSDHVDMRSMSEMMVDYAREQADTHSEVSAGTQLGRYYDDDSDSEHPFHQSQSWGRNSLHRSVSQPSLARSATEVVEQWTAPEGDVTPTPGRRIRGPQGLTTFTSSEVRTFQATREWRE
ncbi:zona pellucida domain protein papillote isoform X2 [Anticarsia gemmatalis]|uniref:zona pellucida domain protein papillote isoform X2 n=1 Tax=Anticarsia gemmatalis TaxID=129554 RepID=UPI003F757CA6